MPRFQSSLLVLSLAALLLVPASATRLAAQTGEFEREYPEAAALLDAADAAHAALIERLYAGDDLSAAGIEGATYDRLFAQIAAARADRSTYQVAMPSFARFAPRVADIFEQTRTLRRTLYDIHADEGITDKAAAVDRAIDAYLSRRDAALPAEPKSMTMMTMGGHGGHGGDHNASMIFRQRYPNANGLIWASKWLQIALFDPLLYYSTEEERREGVEAVVNRFAELVQDAPANFPTALPTPPAVAPELVRLYPRAAAIFDNLNQLHDVIVDVLVDEAETDKRTALQVAVTEFQDPQHMAIAEYDWILTSLRNGIFYQGGPAIGELERPERNTSHMTHTGSILPPGGMSPGAMPSNVPNPEADAPDHSAHQ